MISSSNTKYNFPVQDNPFQVSIDTNPRSTHLKRCFKSSRDAMHFRRLLQALGRRSVVERASAFGACELARWLGGRDASETDLLIDRLLALGLVARTPSLYGSGTPPLYALTRRGAESVAAEAERPGRRPPGSAPRCALVDESDLHTHSWTVNEEE